MTDSNSPKRKTLGIKAASDTGTAARKTGNRPVRVSDLNRNRVRAVTEGIKRAQQNDGGKSAGRRAPGEAQSGGDVRKPRPPRPADGERQARPRRAEGEARPPRRFGDDDNRPRRYGDDRGEARPRRFEGNESRPPRRFGDDDKRPRRYGDDRGEARPRRFEGNESRPPRRFGDDDNRPRRYGDDRGEARPRRFEGNESRPPRRFGDDDNRPRRYGDDRGEARPRRFEGNESRPPRRFGDDDNRPRRYGDDRGEARPRRFEGNESRPPRRFGDDDNRPRRYGDDRGEARPRRFEGNESRPPRRFGDDDNRPRRYGDDENRPRRPAPTGERRHEGSAPARRFSDAADRIRTAGTSRPQAPAPRPQQPARADAAPEATHDDGLVRLSKRMSELGLCSRREADEWIPRGWVLVDGKPVTELGSRIRPDAEIEILQEARSEQGERVTVLLHKPVGYVSGQAEDGYEPAAVLFTAENQWEGDPSRKRFAPWQRKSLAPAGRLDIDSTGLLVLTQDGRVARALIGEDSNVEKEYLVRVVWHGPQGAVERNVSEAFPADQLELLRHGLSLDGVLLKPAKVSWQNEEQLRFVLREGRKRQIRRMCEQVGLEVVGLKRVRMGRVVLGDLPPGKWRFLGQFEKF
ncbi:pseudouridine synthase [Cupriavidus oxalaticus]|uniref:Dual-specificity RNA pseudouridine synthase RluF n=2 Tax=Cupriavidus TaxID=106589 RepID=A0A4P7LG81_9BURK|nr:pseudouridine synthase [Cupriavidus oxalaticus]QBY53369.1 pseudouridine synthase [Cupriavidus oxalaticus]